VTALVLAAVLVVIVCLVCLYLAEASIRQRWPFPPPPPPTTLQEMLRRYGEAMQESMTAIGVVIIPNFTRAFQQMSWAMNSLTVAQCYGCRAAKAHPTSPGDRCLVHMRLQVGPGPPERTRP
jgi:hypothetical protein